MPDEQEATRLAWNVFWQTDHAQACLPRDTADGLEFLETSWQRFVLELPDGARLLDVGTGNGAVALLAQRTARSAGRHIHISGVDAADIDPPRYRGATAPELNEINFHPRVSMESLPFADDMFDAVVGQFALEYSDTRRSVPEIMRVIRPDGRFRFLVHAEEAALKARCAGQREQAETILSSDLFERTQAVLSAIATAQESGTESGPTADQALARAQQRITALGQTIQLLERAFAGSSDRDLADRLLTAVKSLPARYTQTPVPLLQQTAKDIQTMLRAQALRLRDMETAALSRTERRRLQERFRAAGGIGVSLTEACRKTALVGFWLEGRRHAIEAA